MTVRENIELFSFFRVVIDPAFPSARESFSGQIASVTGDAGPGRIRGRVGDQVQYGAGHLLRLCVPPHGNLRDDRIMDLFVCKQRRCEAGTGKAGQKSIDADFVCPNSFAQARVMVINAPLVME